MTDLTIKLGSTTDDVPFVFGLNEDWGEGVAGHIVICGEKWKSAASEILSCLIENNSPSDLSLFGYGSEGSIIAHSHNDSWEYLYEFSPGESDEALAKLYEERVELFDKARVSTIEQYNASHGHLDYVIVFADQIDNALEYFAQDGYALGVHVIACDCPSLGEFAYYPRVEIDVEDSTSAVVAFANTSTFVNW